MTVKDFKNYMLNDFSNDVVNLITCDNKIYDEYLNSYDGFYEGTIRAAIWSVLRTILPKDWFIQAECQYPDCDRNSRGRADIVVWPPAEKSFVIEVKPFVGIDVIKNDISKLKIYLKNRNKHERLAYMVFTTIYKPWKQKDWPNKDWKTCMYCFEKYEIGESMPWGYGDCPNCNFTKETIDFLKEDNIQLIPLFFEIK